MEPAEGVVDANDGWSLEGVNVQGWPYRRRRFPYVLLPYEFTWLAGVGVVLLLYTAPVWILWDTDTEPKTPGSRFLRL